MKCCMSVFLQYIYILFIIFHIIYFEHILSPPQLLPDLPYLSISPISPVLFPSLPSLFLKQVNPSQNQNNIKKKTKTNKRPPIRQKQQKKTKGRQKTQTWSSFCVSQIHEACRGVWLIYLVETLLEKTDFLLPSGCLLQNSFLIRDGTLCPLYRAGCLSGLKLCRLVHTVTASMSSYVLQSCCAWMMLLPWNHPPPLALTIFSLSLPFRSLNLVGRI